MALIQLPIIYYLQGGVQELEILVDAFDIKSVIHVDDSRQESLPNAKSVLTLGHPLQIPGSPDVIQCKWSANKIAFMQQQVVITNRGNTLRAVSCKGMPWTGDQEQMLRQLFDAKYSYEIIAQKMGRTRGAIQGRLKKLRLIKWNQTLKKYT